LNFFKEAAIETLRTGTTPALFWAAAAGICETVGRYALGDPQFVKRGIELGIIVGVATVLWELVNVYKRRDFEAALYNDAIRGITRYSEIKYEAKQDQFNNG